MDDKDIGSIDNLYKSSDIVGDSNDARINDIENSITQSLLSHKTKQNESFMCLLKCNPFQISIIVLTIAGTLLTGLGIYIAVTKL
jgi:hypothetical protein